MPTRHPDIYRSAAWKQVRRAVLERDGYRCQVKGAKCKGQATEVDHIVPVADGGAAYDPVNLRASCRPCNQGRASAQKHHEGWRRSSTHIVLVTGPPGAGKSTYVREHRKPGDFVIDYDLIAEAVGCDERGDPRYHRGVSIARGALLTELRRGEVPNATVWLVSANPRAATQFPHHELVVLDPGNSEAKGRARGRDGSGHLDSVVDGWYATPQPRSW